MFGAVWIAKGWQGIQGIAEVLVGGKIRVTGVVMLDFVSLSEGGTVDWLMLDGVEEFLMREVG